MAEREKVMEGYRVGGGGGGLGQIEHSSAYWSNCVTDSAVYALCRGVSQHHHPPRSGWPQIPHAQEVH